MDTHSARQVAALAGTSAPRVLRAAEALGLGVTEPGGARHKRRFGAEQTRQLVARLGERPTPPIAGLLHSDASVLAALAGSPLGLSSARAVSRATGLSPTTASAALGRLTQRGLVRRHRSILAEGQAQVREVLTVDVTHPEWAGLAPALHLGRPAGRRRRGGPVPARLGHVFWNEDLTHLTPEQHGALIAKRVLQSRDPQALAWAAGRLTRQDWERAARARGIDARDASLARLLAAAAAS